MTKKTRLILFLSLAILFLVVAPAIVFYSLGWRLDWQAKKFVQPGVFYFRIQPKGAQVYLDGKLKKKTDFFFGSVFIENILPKKYEIEIKKQGYQSWRKVLEVKEREVTEAKNIILIPQKVSFNVLAEQVNDLSLSSTFLRPYQKVLDLFLNDSKIISEENEQKKQEKIKKIKETIPNDVLEEFEKITQSAKGFEFSPDFKKLVYFNDYELWILFLEKKYDQPQKEPGDKLFLTRFSEKIKKVSWFTNYYLIFDAGSKIKIAETDDRDEINIVDLSQEFEEPEIFWDQENKKLYVLSQEILYLSEKLLP